MSAYAYSASATKRLTAFVLFVIGVALTVGLFYVKTRAQTAKSEVVKLERLIKSEHRAIAVLDAELAFRESPERLAGLALTHLEHEPITLKNTLRVEELAAALPLREEDPLTTGGGEK